MKLSDLKPASALAKNLGVKAVLYGGPGIGKTPTAATAPNPVMLACEPGLLSLRKNTTLPCFEGYTGEKVDEYFKWFFESAEAKKFDTLIVDSISQMAEIYLTQELKRNKDGRKAYGEMSRRMMSWLEALYFMPQKHTVLIAKQQLLEDGNSVRKRPYFPGQELHIKVPHLFDEILHFARTTVPGVPGQVPAIRTKETFDIMARDRTGNLSEFEQPNLADIFAKCMK